MIRRYGDHAANERTFLAWVRTAIAVMAFGFIIERFDLFLLLATKQEQAHSLPLHGQRFANVVGLIFILLGVSMIAIAGVRFFKTAKEIDSDADVPSTGSRFDLALAVLLAVLGLSLFLYMSRAVMMTL